MIKSADILEIYKQKYGKATMQVAAPGRANIIGEHTDYNHGYVLPFAVNKRIYFAAGPNKGDHFQIYSFNKNKELTLYPSQSWNKGFAKYFSSVLTTFDKHKLKYAGLNIVFGGDLPIGAGMSSSSAITCGFIGLLNQHQQLGLTKDDIVHLAVEAEHGAGLQGGNMDQYSIVHGQANQAILLDCLYQTSQPVDFDLGENIFCLFNTNVIHNLEETEYNTRSSTTKNAFLKLKSEFREIKSYRDVTQSHLPLLNDREQKRVSHILTENQRVEATVEAIATHDMKEIGKLLHQSHESLRDMYEVSCPELDFIQAYLMEQEGVLGARMMGGGFGGCVITLMRKDSLQDIAIQLEQTYKEAYDLLLEVYPIKPEAGLLVQAIR